MISTPQLCELAMTEYSWSPVFTLPVRERSESTSPLPVFEYYWCLVVHSLALRL